MRPSIAAAAAALVCGFSAVATAPVLAQSCADLWYERNLIYARNGYCFSTSLARRAFAEFECWTTNPKLTRYEQDRVAAIKAEERRRGCKVNE
jgi:hypothetical protein